MDNHSIEQRHYNMSRIKSKNTKPEEQVRKFLFAHGFRYRKNVKRYPGHPDIVLPKSNLDYWQHKFKRNKEKDYKFINELESLD